MGSDPSPHRTRPPNRAATAGWHWRLASADRNQQRSCSKRILQQGFQITARAFSPRPPISEAPFVSFVPLVFFFTPLPSLRVFAPWRQKPFSRFTPSHLSHLLTFHT